MRCDNCKEYKYEIKELKKEIEELEEKLWRLKHLKKCGHCEKVNWGHWADCPSLKTKDTLLETTPPALASSPPESHCHNGWRTTWSSLGLTQLSQEKPGQSQGSL